jgi:hypothetical protein
MSLIYGRVTGTHTTVGTSMEELTGFTVPAHLRIRRVRAVKNSGSGTTIALQVRETTGVSTGLPIVLEYAATATAIDSEELMYAQPSAVDGQYGTLYVAIQSTHAGDSITVSLDFEKVN